VKSAAESLRDVAEELKGLSTSTERDFLDVGAQLESIVVRARQKADTLTGLLGNAAGEQGQALAGALDHVAAWAEGCGQDGSAEKSLASLLQVARSVSRPLWNLKNAVQILRAMGVAMLVESARLGASASDFDALGREVGRLAVSVDKKADAILDAVDLLRRRLEHTQRTAARLGREQQEDLVRLMAECSAGLADLRAEHAAIFDVSQSAQAGFQRVVAGIGSLVVNLQFHDSTRQRIEHIEEALTRLAGDLAGDSNRPGNAVQVLELQAAQLNDASSSFQSTVGQVRADLHGLSETAADFARMARQLCGNASAATGLDAIQAKSASRFGGIEDHFSKVGTAVADWSASRRTLGEAAHHAHEACSRMSGMVAEVETVGRHMFRLALNAEIQAFQMSASGEVMVAVADNIRGVSRDASANAAAVGHALREVQTSAAGLDTALGEDLAAQAQEAGTMASQIREAATELRARNGESRRMLQSIADDGEALAQEIAALRQGLTADGVMADVSGSCLEALETIAASERRAAGDPDAESHAALLHEALRSYTQTYTMRAEREVHESLMERAMGGAAAPSLAVVAEPLSSGDTGFGDNVELF
jgi:hypothetical protein